MPNVDRLSGTNSLIFPELLSDINFYPNKLVIVALSGGSDSLAMAVILKHYLDRFYPDVALLAVTVDHGLRAESAQEALSVGKQCQALSINHEIVRWEGEKPRSGIQRAAREARYALLSSAAKRHDTNLVFTGHTLDDNLETIAMRRARSSASGAVSGISKFTLYRNEIWFARPLLSVAKQDLRAQLKHLNICWIDDPSNMDTRFERVRVRLGQAADLPAKINIDEGADKHKAVCDLLSDNSLVDFSNWPQEIRMFKNAVSHVGFFRGVSVLISLISKTSYLPILKKTSQGVSPIEGIEILFKSAANNTKFTIGGCLMVVEDDFVVIKPEQRNRGRGVFGFDLILPDHNYDTAQVLRRRCGLPDLPPVPALYAAR